MVSAEDEAKLKELAKKDPEQARKLKRALKKKRSKEKAKQESKVVKQEEEEDEKPAVNGAVEEATQQEEVDREDDVEIEYVAQPLEDPEFEEFKEVFEKFKIVEKDETGGDEEGEEGDQLAEGKSKLATGDEEDEDEDEDAENQKMSKKQLKALKRPSVSALKQTTHRPEVVEFWDTTSPDPRLLVFLKSLRNTIEVPRHWSQKRKYMAGKKGVEKNHYELPQWLEFTGIAKIREALLEKEAQKSAKQKQREKARPKASNKINIDYQALQTAFFKLATKDKPKMTRFGDLYFEGKEYEAKMKHFKPGILTDKIKAALAMPEGAPPPWLINMQRYGPPPSYPKLKIPGLNAPIPPGASYGYHPGGWGKPPVDEYGNPVYGDYRAEAAYQEEEQAAGALWGEPEQQEMEFEEEEEEEEEEQQEGAGGTDTPASAAPGTETPMLDPTGMASVGGMRSVGASSVTSGLETPESVDIRKKGIASMGGYASSSIASMGPKPYQILREAKAPAQPGALFQSTVRYEMPTGRPGQPGGTVSPGGTSTPAIGGTVTPFGAPGGAQTPLAISGPPRPGGAETPGAGGMTMSLNPTDLEQEGVFAADVIRKQLKEQEEAAMKATKGAGQIDVNELKKRKAPSSGTVSAGGEASVEKKKKRKKEEKFKF
ncbi:unnamed protein product [Vitrella brassicaformis CCMP3155]|uniref:PSP proline-rich domain-containing protein n=1 Tax=Vitrella brassicaformis (strain CCMP3155) TaxID=1169540 RepID=A0A0G4H195_VITBC|nr:unnamed protein product [Vitrella brassicaformis CCMP3155]|mmetsp:Transcript_31654/g.78407  ORF Transcript_31654/g.78407 Transcript_31654/m.78407 type:complete len:657 (-) Transcript_31654:359-2329(-)|eukprot:CEM37361.1 unnamed protein product [Vitrella brassicaformis CCMP3155]